MSIPEIGICASRRAYSVAMSGLGSGSSRGGRDGWVSSRDGGSSASMRAWAAARWAAVGSGSISV